MPPRFYCPTLSSAGPAMLSEGEAHHLAHVMRLATGDAVELFNGRGLVGQATIAAVRKRDVECVVSATVQEPVPLPELILATAVPKGERFDWLVEKATELGVSRLIPLHTGRSTVDPRDTKLDRLRQTVISACKQSRRSHLMDLSPLTAWRDLLKQVRGPCLLVADPQGMPLNDLVAESGNPPDGAAWVACVGPEGGFTAEEIASVLDQGGRLVGLGTPVLRIETAGIALATWGLLQRRALPTVSTGP